MISALKIPKIMPILKPPRLTVKKAANARAIYNISKLKVMKDEHMNSHICLIICTVSAAYTL